MIREKIIFAVMGVLVLLLVVVFPLLNPISQKNIIGSAINVHAAATTVALPADKRIVADKLVTSIVP